MVCVAVGLIYSFNFTIKSNWPLLFFRLHITPGSWLVCVAVGLIYSFNFTIKIKLAVVFFPPSVYGPIHITPGAARPIAVFYSFNFIMNIKLAFKF